MEDYLRCNQSLVRSEQQEYLDKVMAIFKIDVTLPQPVDPEILVAKIRELEERA